MLAAFAAPARADTEIVILTGGTSGVYYPLGIAMAKIYERTVPGARVTVQATQASVENFNLLQQRRGVIAFGQGDVMSDAFKGNAEAGFPSSRVKDKKPNTGATCWKTDPRPGPIWNPFPGCFRKTAACW